MYSIGVRENQIGLSGDRAAYFRTGSRPSPTASIGSLLGRVGNNFGKRALAQLYEQQCLKRHANAASAYLKWQRLRLLGLRPFAEPDRNAFALRIGHLGEIGDGHIA